MDTKTPPPFEIRAVLEAFGVELRGWYVESAEGVLTPFADDPDETVELSEEMDRAAAA
jgi:hypothetical protein